jgi:hypothetical protein
MSTASSRNMEKDEVQLIVDDVIKAICPVLDKHKIVWLTKTVRQFRAAVTDIIKGSVHQGADFQIRPLSFSKDAFEEKPIEGDVDGGVGDVVEDTMKATDDKAEELFQDGMRHLKAVAAGDSDSGITYYCGGCGVSNTPHSYCGEENCPYKR